MAHNIRKQDWIARGDYNKLYTQIVSPKRPIKFWYKTYVEYDVDLALYAEWTDKLGETQKVVQHYENGIEYFLKRDWESKRFHKSVLRKYLRLNGVQ